MKDDHVQPISSFPIPEYLGVSGLRVKPVVALGFKAFNPIEGTIRNLSDQGNMLSELIDLLRYDLTVVTGKCSETRRPFFIAKYIHFCLWSPFLRHI